MELDTSTFSRSIFYKSLQIGQTRPPPLGVSFTRVYIHDRHAHLLCEYLLQEFIYIIDMPTFYASIFYKSLYTVHDRHAHLLCEYLLQEYIYMIDNQTCPPPLGISFSRVYIHDRHAHLLWEYFLQESICMIDMSTSSGNIFHKSLYKEQTLTPPLGISFTRVYRKDRQFRHAHLICEFILQESIERIYTHTSSGSIFFKSLQKGQTCPPPMRVSFTRVYRQDRHAHLLWEYLFQESLDRIDTHTSSGSIFYKILLTGQTRPPSLGVSVTGRSLYTLYRIDTPTSSESMFYKSLQIGQTRRNLLGVSFTKVYSASRLPWKFILLGSVAPESSFFNIKVDIIVHN